RGPGRGRAPRARARTPRQARRRARPARAQVPGGGRVMRSLQFDSDGRLKHFLTIDGLSRRTILDILDTARSFISVGQREIKKVPLARGRTVVNLFFEPSTRTRTTFEIGRAHV